jgi:hypothetical protein
MKLLINSDEHVKNIANGDANKQRIYDLLVKEGSMSRRVCMEKLSLTKNQFTHFINYLSEEMHVKVNPGICPVYKNKVHILTANEEFPYVARTFDEIKAEREEYNNQQKVVNPHMRVIRNLDRPGSDYAWQRKKTTMEVFRSSSLDFI